jgi:hypothetical protein
MKIPKRDSRLIVAQLFTAVLDESHRRYFPKVKFPRAVEATTVLFAILIAEAEGKPRNELGLAKRLQMSRQTLGRRLKDIEATGMIRRDGRHISLAAAKFATPSGEAAIRFVSQLIIDAAKSLSEIA